MIGAIISGLCAAGAAIAGGVSAKRNQKRQEKANKKLAEQQQKLNEESAAKTEAMRQAALLTDPALQVQGYKNAGLSTAGLTPSANSVSAISPAQIQGTEMPDYGSKISDSLQTGLSLYNTINQTKSLKESLRSQQLDNDAKELDLDEKRGYHDYFSEWFSTEKYDKDVNGDFGNFARTFAAIRNEQGKKQNGGSFRAMSELSSWLEENDSLAVEDKNYQRQVNLKLNKLKVSDPDHFKAIVSMPEYQKRNLLFGIEKLDTETEFLKWKHKNEKDNDFNAWLNENFGKDTKMQSKLALGFFRVLKELFGK